MMFRFSMYREDEARRFDPDLLSFFNINRPEDLARALELA